MKIVKKSLKIDDSINVTGYKFRCNRCYCKFLIENKSDYKVKLMDNYEANIPKMMYTFNCPECKDAVSYSLYHSKVAIFFHKIKRLFIGD